MSSAVSSIDVSSFADAVVVAAAAAAADAGGADEMSSAGGAGNPAFIQNTANSSANTMAGAEQRHTRQQLMQNGSDVMTAASRKLVQI